MKRLMVWCLGLALCLPAAAEAQLTTQMGNDWTFTFSGNVNAFYVLSLGGVNGGGPAPTINGGLTSTDEASRIRTGLLPSEFMLEATGKVNGLDLGVHFGVYPQIQNASIHDNFGNGTQAGAQIDLRQVFLTVGGGWGQIKAGRDLSLFGRQNILTDMTLFGTGPSGGVVGAGGTTLGRIGYGYIYPNFNAQLTYSTPANKPGQLSVGLFDPDKVPADAATFSGTRLPRVEAEATWTGHFGMQNASGTRNSIMLWANGMLQQTDLTPNDFGSGTNPSLTSSGIGGGAKVGIAGLSLVGSAYFASGVGTTLYFNLPADPVNDTRNSYGFILQGSYAITNSKWMVGASYGESDLQQTDNDKLVKNNALVKKNAAFTGMLTNQVTPQLKWVGEYDYIWSANFSNDKVHSNQLSTGLMLFF
ncbi:MAG TPA: porin [Gemmatimonadaceae bacterium]|nr:porin [Gemmatimonadaceae bacterium]